jgi:hypothetical protein
MAPRFDSERSLALENSKLTATFKRVSHSASILLSGVSEMLTLNWWGLFKRKLLYLFTLVERYKSLITSKKSQRFRSTANLWLLIANE